MDHSVHTPMSESIRKIEDIIDIQKANGNFSLRQVAFNLPSSSESTPSANLAKSLESGLYKTKYDGVSKKKLKKKYSKRQKNPLPDVDSWPSDSDITVLRMKLCLTSSDLKENVGNVILGDGIHQPDSSSMVNLATLIRQSQSPSKHSLNIEEYLLPLTSWERQDEKFTTEEPILEKRVSNHYLMHLNTKCNPCDASCSHQDMHENISSKGSDVYSNENMKSKMAKFLRLYFCPCCTCLYKLEKMRDKQSVYFTNQKIT